MPAVVDSDASAREQLSVAAARHHSAGPVVEEVVTRQEGREEEVCEVHEALRRCGRVFWWTPGSRRWWQSRRTWLPWYLHCRRSSRCRGLHMTTPKKVEELVADLARKDQHLLVELEILRPSPTRGRRGSPVEVATAWWSLAKMALVHSGITASPGRYMNTGRAAPCAPAARVPAVLHDPGGA